MESEKAKAKAGKLYDANNDIELVSEREACKEVCYELNSLRPSQKKERESIIRRLFGKTGKSFLIEQPFYCGSELWFLYCRTCLGCGTENPGA